VQVYEVLDNAIDEAQAGFADTVDIIVHTDGSVTISDNGRGVNLDSYLSSTIYPQLRCYYLLVEPVACLPCFELWFAFFADSHGCAPSNRKVCARDCSYGMSYSSRPWTR